MTAQCRARVVVARHGEIGACSCRTQAARVRQSGSPASSAFHSDLHERQRRSRSTIPREAGGNRVAGVRRSTERSTDRAPCTAFRCTSVQDRFGGVAGTFSLAHAPAAVFSRLLIPRSQVRCLPGPSDPAWLRRFRLAMRVRCAVEVAKARVVHTTDAHPEKPAEPLGVDRGARTGSGHGAATGSSPLEEAPESGDLLPGSRSAADRPGAPGGHIAHASPRFQPRAIWSIQTVTASRSASSSLGATSIP